MSNDGSLQPGITIAEATSTDSDIVGAMVRLVPQLSTSMPPPTSTEIRVLLADEATTLFVARDEAGIIGMLTLAMFRIPTGIRAVIEDVVVDESSRSRGVGEVLVDTAIEKARTAGARTVDLTSRPDREAANRLYVRLGFERRTTNVYRFTVS